MKKREREKFNQIISINVRKQFKFNKIYFFLQKYIIFNSCNFFYGSFFGKRKRQQQLCMYIIYYADGVWNNYKSIM